MLLPTWDQFREAMEVFKDDLGIAGHGDELPISPFDPSKEYGQYSLTQIPDDMSEEQFRNQMANVRKITITCMDRRKTRPL